MSKQFSVDKNRLRSLVDRFSGKRVLVIGDMVADEYLIGNPTRISREAPVLILELFEERTVPGGAAMSPSMRVRLAQRSSWQVWWEMIYPAAACARLSSSFRWLRKAC